MENELDLNAILSQDNPDGDVFGGAPEPATPEPVQTAPEQQEQPASTEQTPAAQTEPNPFDEGSAQWKAFERVREAERAKADAEREAAVLRAIADRDAQWQQSMQQAQPQQPDEIPDPITDPDGHARWVKDQIAVGVAQVKQEFDRREQQRQAADFDRETKRLISEAGVPVETIQAALAHVQQHEPWMVQGLNNAPNPFKAVMEHAKRIGFNAPNAPATQTPSSDAIPDHIRQKVLADEAAKRAAAGAPPQMQVPRGVGSVPSGAGFSDALPPPSEYSKLSPAEYEAVKAKILSQ